MFYTSDASNPNWTHIQTVYPGSGAYSVDMTYTIPTGGEEHAVRVQMNYYYAATTPCHWYGIYRERDDLVFHVLSGPALPSLSPGM